MRETTLCILIEGAPPQRILLGMKKEGFGAGKITGFGGKIELGETPAMAAIRELEEEAGIRVTCEELEPVGQLHFHFPSRPDWSQLVHVFLSQRWLGTAREGREMKPMWYAVGEIPFGQMWDDATHWLPRFLGGERIRGCFRFAEDNETVAKVAIRSWKEWSTGGHLE